MEPKLVVIVGETASGKSALALKLAKLLNGEIIAADSRTVYKGMDIGTAKPTGGEQKQTPHHLIDVIEPNQNFTAADFKNLANQAILEITNKNRLPIMVGGTGLYIDSVLYDYQFSKRGTERDPNNPRHLLSSGEDRKRGLRENTLIIGLSPQRDELKERVARRVDEMLTAELVEEVRALVKHYGWEAKAFQAPGYRAFTSYLKGELSLNEARELFIKNDLDLAKRQRTWFKRNNSIHWVNNSEEAVDLVTTFLNKKQ